MTVTACSGGGDDPKCDSFKSMSADKKTSVVMQILVGRGENPTDGELYLATRNVAFLCDDSKYKDTSISELIE